MSCHLQRNFLSLIAKRWYCMCKLSKSEKQSDQLKGDYLWQEPNPRLSKLSTFKKLDCNCTSQLPATHCCTRYSHFWSWSSTIFLYYTTLILIYDVLSSFSLYYLRFMKVNKSCGPGAENWELRVGYEGQGPGAG